MQAGYPAAPQGAPPAGGMGEGDHGPGPSMAFPGMPQYGMPQPPNPQLQAALQSFWAQQLQETESMTSSPNEFKSNNLPLARIKKIMKSDEDVRMIAAEAPVLFAKACEMFIFELTSRAWFSSDEAKRRTLQRADIAAAIAKTDIFDFLLDIVPCNDPNIQPVAAGAGPPGSVPYLPNFMPGSAPPGPAPPGPMTQGGFHPPTGAQPYSGHAGAVAGMGPGAPSQVQGTLGEQADLHALGMLEGLDGQGLSDGGFG